MNLSNIKIVAGNIKNIFWRYITQSKELKHAQWSAIKEAHQKSDEEKIKEIRSLIKSN